MKTNIFRNGIGFLAIFLIINILQQVSGQVQDQGKGVLSISRQDYSNNAFRYGIQRLPGPVKELEMVYLRGFTLVNTTSPEAILPVYNSPVVIGFFGFGFSEISDCPLLVKCKPVDSTIQPRVQNLIADVFNRNKIMFDIVDISAIQLNIYSQTENGDLFRELGKVTDVASITHFYLLWNRGKRTELPELFSSGKAISMPLSAPFKIPWDESGRAVTEVIQAPVKPVQKPKPPPEKKSIPDNSKSLPSTSVPQVVHQSIYDELLFFVRKEMKEKGLMLHVDQPVIKLLHNQGSDSLFVYTTNITIRPEYRTRLHLKIVEVKYIQSQETRRTGVEDPELKIYANRVSKSISFMYKGHELTYDPTLKRLFIPEPLNDYQSITAKTRDARVLVNVPPLKRGYATSVEVVVDVPKTPIIVMVKDAKSSYPVNMAYVEICPSKINLKPVYSAVLNPVDTIRDLCKDSEIEYRVIVRHPDFFSLKPLPVVNELQFDSGLNLQLELRPAFNIFYIEISSLKRQDIRMALEIKMKLIQENNQPFLIFLSNNEKPVLANDPQTYEELLRLLPVVLRSKPSFTYDFKLLSESIPYNSIPKGYDARLHFFVSGKNLEKVNPLINEMYSFIRNKIDPYKQRTKPDPVVISVFSDEIESGFYGDKNRININLNSISQSN